MKTLRIHFQRAAVAAVVAMVCAAPTGSRADLADDFKISHLEQQVHDLQNQVLQESRRIDALESAMTKSRAGVMPQAPAPGAGDAKTPEVTTAWLNSANWDKVRPGMPEANVLSLLGPPTTIRASGNGSTQTLFYSLELEAGGFLYGRVIIADHRVVEIHKPELR